MFTSEKMMLSNLFLETYLSYVPWDMPNIYREIDKKLGEISYRRPIHTHLFKEMGKKIRKYGLKKR